MGLAEWAAAPAAAHRTWDKWASASVGPPPDHPLTAALLLNYDPSSPSRATPLVVEQRGTRLTADEVAPFVEVVRRNRLPRGFFFLGSLHYVTTTVQERWFAARCVNSGKSDGEGVIVIHVSSFLFVALYDGAVASRAMAAADRLAFSLSRKNLS